MKWVGWGWFLGGTCGHGGSAWPWGRGFRFQSSILLLVSVQQVLIGAASQLPVISLLAITGGGGQVWISSSGEVCIQVHGAWGLCMGPQQDTALRTSGTSCSSDEHGAPVPSAS